MLRSKPPGEDATNGARAVPLSINSDGTPPGEDGMQGGRVVNSAPGQQIENEAQRIAAEPEGVAGAGTAGDGSTIDFLRLVRDAETQALLYTEQANQRAWSQSYRAFHNEHYIGSKYTKPEWRGRSRLFVPKTRAAVRKDTAAVAASLFNNIDAINCLPGNEGDPKQRAAASIMEELVNYRTDRTSGKAAFPWFLVSMGARQDAVLTGVCASKQYWKQEFRKGPPEKVLVEGPDGVHVQQDREVYILEIDRPEMAGLPPENYIIDPSADWTNPAQSASFFIIKWPMQLHEIKRKQESPVNPWKPVEAAVLKTSVESGKWDAAAIRRAREMGLDRLDETQTGTTFQIIWVYECFIRAEDGEDYTFYSVGDQQFLTDPKPTREVYPEQFGERPIALGYGNLEAHRIYPMAPAESWQPLQLEVNDLRNLRLDASKQNVMPISKVRRGRQIDLDQVKRRSSGSSILVQEPDDVTWEQSPQIPPSVVEISRELDIEFDDLAGVQNFGNVQQNNALGKTLGGLKLASGAANAVQEFDIRVWIETWATPALSQVVRLEQYYESDKTVLGLCGQRAQLWEKYGINKIDDDLLEQEITVRVSVGLGAGDPQQRLAKFQTAAQIAVPIIASSPEFQSGKREVNIEAVIEEVFGAAGYKDGGARFFKDNGQPRPNPMQDLNTAKIKSEITKNEQTGKAALFGGLAALAKVALGKRELEADVVDMMLGYKHDATAMGFEHGARHNDQHLSALDHGHRHGLAITHHRRDLSNDAHQREQAATEAMNGGDDETEGAAGRPQAPPAASSGAGPQAPSSASPPTTGGVNPAETLLQLLQEGKLDVLHDPHTGRVAGFRLAHPQ